MTTLEQELAVKLQRVKDLEAAKARLEARAINQQREIAKARAEGRVLGEQEVIKHLLPVLPKTTLSSQSVSYRVLVKEVNKIIEESKKSKKC